MLLPTLLGLGVVNGARLLRRLQERRREALAAGPSIERLAADLRRLRAALHLVEEPMPQPGRGLRLRATRGAYVDALTAACRALELPAPQVTRQGAVAEAEIYRAEAALRSCGLDVRGRAVH